MTATRRDKGDDIEEREIFAGLEFGVLSTYRRAIPVSALQVSMTDVEGRLRVDAVEKVED